MQARPAIRPRVETGVQAGTKQHPTPSTSVHDSRAESLRDEGPGAVLDHHGISMVSPARSRPDNVPVGESPL